MGQTEKKLPSNQQASTYDPNETKMEPLRSGQWKRMGQHSGCAENGRKVGERIAECETKSISI